MILAFDTYYFDEKARTVCFAFEQWTDSLPTQTHTAYTSPIAEYEPGNFYKRELPCILQVLDTLNLDDVEVIVIDGYVIIDDDGHFGLGGHLYHVLQERIPIIGVAKTKFASNTLYVRQFLRGKSEVPLYITAIGIDVTVAATHVHQMHGEYRMPTLLKSLDALTRIVEV